MTGKGESYLRPAFLLRNQESVVLLAGDEFQDFDTHAAFFHEMNDLRRDALSPAAHSDHFNNAAIRHGQLYLKF